MEVRMDVSDPVDGSAEDVGIRLAFLDEGVGRAEVDARGGSLGTSDRLAIAECWDGALNRIFAGTTIARDGATLDRIPDGDTVLANCGALFSRTLGELSVPALEDIDPNLRAALFDIAENGIPR